MTMPPGRPSSEPIGADCASAGERATEVPPWWAELEWDEPTEADLHGCWPDPLAGPPDSVEDGWLADLCDEQLSALAELDQAAFVARGGRPGAPGPIPAGFTHRPRPGDIDEEPDPDPGERPVGPGTGFEAGGALDKAAPDPALAGFTLDAFEQISGLSDDELVGMVLAARRLAAQNNGVELSALAELDRRRQAGAGRPGSSRADEHVAEEFAAALVLTGRSAEGLLGLCRGLARLPVVVAALLAGRIDRPRAVVFAEELAGLSDLAAQAIAAALIDAAGNMTTGQLRAALRAKVLGVDPKAVRKRAERAAGEARVESWAEGSGNAGLAGRELPPADVIAADRTISAIARELKAAGVPGRMNQLRAKVFCALLTGRDPATLIESSADPPSPGTASSDNTKPGGSAGPSSGPVQPAGPVLLAGSVNLTMPLATWLGEADRPGEVAGLGPVDAATCRDLGMRFAARHTQWCVTLTVTDGRAVGHACARAGPGPPAEGTDTGPGPPRRWPIRWLRQQQFAWLERGTCAHRRQSASYQPPDKLRHLITIRHRTCSFPGCRRQAARCDLDHTVPFDLGGLTCECNLASLCRRHHRCKQAEGWHLAQPEPGILTWTLPHRRSYIVEPDAYPI